MKGILLLLIVVFLALSAAKDLRIKGAKPAKIKDFPCVASVIVEGEFATHGLILNNRVILSSPIE